ncbi:YaaC family protein [Schinkia azotoformans]|uniref:YaaC family protein n=1 Tax=Schinkia azotoformans TaxID=1454 RepID=UPI002DB98F76|nr:YaaC family protein [Schinkia azotoformans]MEC1717215.1 YaaC family protein [Schinkia azotoformans]
MSEKKLQRLINKSKSLEENHQKLKKELSDLREANKPLVERPSSKYNKRDLVLRKTVVSPEFDKKTVLTDSHWHYIELYLRAGKGEKCLEAANYWNQAKNFYEATKNLDLVAKPLTTYYCFLNATKALLTYKGVSFDLKHGISGKHEAGQIKLQNEYISIHKKGVLAGLCKYLEEPIRLTQRNRNVFGSRQTEALTIGILSNTVSLIATENRQPFENKLRDYLTNRKKTESLPETYTLKSILYNLEFIHRAYKLTFNSEPELFIPIVKPRFVFDKNSNMGWLEFQLEVGDSNPRALSNIEDFEIDHFYNSKVYYLRAKDTFIWSSKNNQDNLEGFINYYKKYRKKFVYIYSTNELWYYKRTNLKTGIIKRNSMVLTLAAMHRLSEMSRYDPNRLDAHLSSQHGWLLSEFINKSLYQFIDMISSEISGDDFRATGFRN